MTALRSASRLQKKSDKPADKKGDKDARAKSDGKGGATPEPKPEAAQKPKTDTELPQDEADNAEPPPMKSARSPKGLYEFHEDRWVELYSKWFARLPIAMPRARRWQSWRATTTCRSPRYGGRCRALS
jgi:uncharacterized protein